MSTLHGVPYTDTVASGASFLIFCPGATVTDKQITDANLYNWIAGKIQDSATSNSPADADQFLLVKIVAGLPTLVKHSVATIAENNAYEFFSNIAHEIGTANDITDNDLLVFYQPGESDTRKGKVSILSAKILQKFMDTIQSNEADMDNAKMIPIIYNDTIDKFGYVGFGDLLDFIRKPNDAISDNPYSYNEALFNDMNYVKCAKGMNIGALKQPSLNFNAGGKRVELPVHNNLVFKTGSFSVTFQQQFPISGNAVDYNGIVSKGWNFNYNAGTFGIVQRSSSPNNLGYYENTSTGSYDNFINIDNIPNGLRTITVVRDSFNKVFNIYVDGVLFKTQTFTTAANISTTSKMYFRSIYGEDRTLYNKDKRFMICNFAMTYDDVKLAHNRGRFDIFTIPEAWKWGAAASIISYGDCEAGLPNIGGTAIAATGGAVALDTAQKVSGLKSVKYTGNGSTSTAIKAGFSNVFSALAGKRLRVNAKVYIPSANTVLTTLTIGIMNSSGTTIVGNTVSTKGSWQDITCEVDRLGSGANLITFQSSATATSETFYIDDIEIIQPGVVCDYNPTTIGKMIWKDASANAHDATIVGTLDILIDYVETGYNDGTVDSVERLFNSGSAALINVNSQLNGYLPAGWKIGEIIIENRGSASVTITIGSAAAGADIVSSIAIGAGVTSILTIAKRFFSKTTNTNLYISSSSWGNGKVVVDYKVERIL